MVHVRRIVPRRIVVALLLASLPGQARAASRRVAVLEYRAGVKAAADLAGALARQLSQLTAHKVLAPVDARRRFGSGLDAEVARCSGAPACIAALGRRLDSDEVILVGLSQLGDLIIAIQRVKASQGKVLGRLADSLGPTQEIDAQRLRGYLRRLLPPEDFKRYGQIIVRSAHSGDRLFLDGQLKGRTPLQPLRVPAPGSYQIRVTRPAHLPFVAKLDVLPEATVEVSPTLTPRSKPLRWYQHWWVWAVVGGVVASAATAVAVVSVSRGPDSVPAYVRQEP